MVAITANKQSLLAWPGVLGALVLALQALPAGAQVVNDDLRYDLDPVYQGWNRAMATRNFNLWKQTTATHRQAITHNLVVSRKDRWPDAIFAFPVRAPEMSTLTYLATIQKDNTAHMVFFGPVDFGVLEPAVEIPDNILMLRFVKEAAGWRFDNTRFFNLNDSPVIRNQCHARDLSFLADEQFLPTGAIPAAPVLITPPDYVGEVWIAAIGYRTTVKIGDLHESIVANNEVTDVVNGGLWRDGRKVTVTAEPLEIPAGAKRYLEVGIYALRPGNTAVRVWSYKPVASEAAKPFEGKVYANAVTIPGG